MIYWNGNEYRTLDQKLYYGGTQIAAAYWGNQLVYPEKKIEIDGIQIDVSPYYVNGNMYDTGYKPTKNTRFEICFQANGVVDNSSQEFFGTHHDTKIMPYYSYTFATDGVSKGSRVGNSKQYETNENVGGYNNKTNFHLLIREDNNLMSFRYGGSQNANSNENVLENPENGKNFFVEYTDDNKLNFGIGNYSRYYYTSKGEVFPESLIKNTKQISDTVFSASDSGGNLWINGVNSKTNSPNKSRPYSTDANGNLLYNDEDIVFYHPTSNSAFYYLIIWEKNQNSTKRLFTQRKTTIKINNVNKDIVVFDVYEFDETSNKFNKDVSRTIYPFKYCKPPA